MQTDVLTQRRFGLRWGAMHRAASMRGIHGAPHRDKRAACDCYS